MKYILFGAGKKLKTVLSVLSRLNDSTELTEIWDTMAKTHIKPIMFKGKEYKVLPPHSVIDECVILITSDRYEEEMRNELERDYLINPAYIRNWRFCLDGIKQRIIRKYKDIHDSQLELNIKFLQEHDLHTFNNGLMEKYRGEYSCYEVYEDEVNGLHYSFWKGKKIYFKRGMNKSDVQNYLNNISCEQDYMSPHCYEQKEINEYYDVVIDVGAAEGFFALEKIENSTIIYLIENDSLWIEALRCTFEPYGEKVRIINKSLGNINSEESITIDKILQASKCNSAMSVLIKMDIEGAELCALKGSDKLRDALNSTLLICVYHNSEDAHDVSSLLLDYHYSVRFSDGYMYFLTDYGDISEDLRHGLIIAKKMAL